ncbi:vitamin K epoxide reductase family protein [Actinopolymorpha rutila]|uniref:Putative membrane protein n=1 Tax=Actinopolymorpha rutila TaxID=446787 RepID=A0A852ZVP4_9ACTN|nr:vitamin K epoxide reductase family protein [Actinopolymorpha rutila]NYH93389.1 putative membrane protein [Actinopolymorpha rutila]
MPQASRPAWAAPVSLVFCLVGLGLSAYLTYAHFTSASALACPDSGTVNCIRVTTSPQSMIFGVVPVAVAGLAYFIGMTALCLPAAWRSESALVRWARLAGGVAGVAMVCYLIYVELLVVGAVCLYCTAVHIVTFLLFVAILAADVLSIGRAHADDLAQDLAQPQS